MLNREKELNNWTAEDTMKELHYEYYLGQDDAQHEVRQAIVYSADK